MLLPHLLELLQQLLLVRLKAIACGADLSFSPDVLLVRPKTIVFGRTYVLAQMFFFRTRDLRDAWADRLKILHDN